MCSITDPRLALIGTAIDELAEAARIAAGNPGARTPDTTAEGAMSQDAMSQDAMAERVARIWAMVADLDPALAHRLSQYTSQPATGQSTPDPGHA
jgi:hypothetical protein